MAEPIVDKIHELANKLPELMKKYNLKDGGSSSSGISLYSDSVLLYNFGDGRFCDSPKLQKLSSEVILSTIANSIVATWTKHPSKRYGYPSNCIYHLHFFAYLGIARPRTPLPSTGKIVDYFYHTLKFT